MSDEYSPIYWNCQAFIRIFLKIISKVPDNGIRFMNPKCTGRADLARAFTDPLQT